MTPPKQLEDLAKAAQTGDSDAADAFCRAARPYVARHLKQRIFTYDVREDMVQEAMLQIMRYLPSFEWRGAKLTSWLYRVAEMMAVNHSRRVCNREMPLWEDSGVEVLEIPAKHGDPFQHCTADDLRRVLIGAMPPAFIETAELLADGADYETIERELAMNAGTVKSQVYRVRKYGRRALAELTQ